MADEPEAEAMLAASMPRLLSTATAAYQRFADRASGAPRRLPTRLARWDVGDLIDHVTWGAAMEAAALHATLGQPAPSATGIDEAVAAFAAAARLPIDPSTALTLPSGTVPAAFAVAVFAFEAALHDLDLAQAIGATDAEFSDDELLACEVVLGPMLDLLAPAATHTAPTGEVSVELIGLGDGLRLNAVGGTWQRAVPTGSATTTITGHPQEIVLFACGRAGTKAVEVHGERVHADQFKSYFPGP